MTPFWQNSLKQLKKIFVLRAGAFVLLYLIISCFSIHGQTEVRNRKPKIEDQKDLQIVEGESLTIQLTDLTVRDGDDWFYPFGFTLQIHSDPDYSFVDQTVIPNEDFEGN